MGSVYANITNLALFPQIRVLLCCSNSDKTNNKNNTLLRRLFYKMYNLLITILLHRRPSPNVITASEYITTKAMRLTNHSHHGRRHKWSCHPNSLWHQSYVSVTVLLQRCDSSVKIKISPAEIIYKYSVPRKCEYWRTGRTYTTLLLKALAATHLLWLTPQTESKDAWAHKTLHITTRRYKSNL